MVGVHEQTEHFHRRIRSRSVEVHENPVHDGVKQRLPFVRESGRERPVRAERPGRLGRDARGLHDLPVVAVERGRARLIGVGIHLGARERAWQSQVVVDVGREQLHVGRRRRLPAGVGIQAPAFLTAVIAIAVPVPAFDRQESVHRVARAADRDAAVQGTVTSAVEEHRERRAIAPAGRAEIDGAAQRARAVGERVCATRHGGVARGQRIDDAIVIVAVGRRDRQSILEQLDAVLVVVDGVEIGATTREEQFIVASSRFRPTRRVRSGACPRGC